MHLTVLAMVGISLTELSNTLVNELYSDVLSGKIKVYNFPFLKFTVQEGDDCMDSKLPTLDLKIWVRDGIIKYEFSEKPMVGNTVVHVKTTLSEQVKFSTLTQEVVRRLLHASRRLPVRRMVECLENMSKKMAHSEHRKN